MPQNEYEFKTDQSLWEEHISLKGLKQLLDESYQDEQWKDQVRKIFGHLNYNILRDFLKTKLTHKQWITENELISIYKEAFLHFGGEPSILEKGWITGSTRYYPHHILALILLKVQKNWKWSGDQGGVFIQDSDSKTTNWIRKPFL